MKIGELAQKTGLAPSRIRFYERIGLLNDKVKRSLIYPRMPAGRWRCRVIPRTPIAKPGIFPATITV
ncbi:MerR family DNA-binding transcriptional regulator [Shewanella algae]|uniref:MerR family DNA-binding transcriptional regulator n=1 Tax=Shewanella algae TaxID=38313 RepID=UPI00214BEA09|nr:MerR family DNA-binding transcriptional regulator [Shewanella algae]